MKLKLFAFCLSCTLWLIAEDMFILRDKEKSIDYGPYIFKAGQSIINSEFALESVQSNSFLVQGYIRGIKYKWGPFCFSNDASVTIAKVPLMIIVVNDHNVMPKETSDGEVLHVNKDSVFQTVAEAQNAQYLLMREACEVLLTDQLLIDEKAIKTVTKISRDGYNSELRRRAMLIYTLIAVLKDNPSEYIVRLGEMRKAFPKSDLIEIARTENCVKTCPVCDGTGKGAKVNCKECAGSATCSFCKGKGIIHRSKKDTDETEKCPDCEGNGKCIYCRETGLMDGPCESCNGNKRRLAVEEIKPIFVSQVKEASLYCHLYYPVTKEKNENTLFNVISIKNDNDAIRALQTAASQAGNEMDDQTQTIKNLIESLKVRQVEQAKIAAELEKVANAEREVRRNEAAAKRALEEDDSVEFAIQKAVRLVKQWIDDGRLIDAKLLSTQNSLYPFAGEDLDYFSKRVLVNFEFRYETNAGFERRNEGPVQMGYIKSEKKWLAVHFNESSVTGVPFLQTTEGREMIERAASDGFRQLDARGPSRGGGAGSGRFRSTDPRWQRMRRIGR